MINLLIVGTFTHFFYKHTSFLVFFFHQCALSVISHWLTYFAIPNRRTKKLYINFLAANEDHMSHLMCSIVPNDFEL